MLGKLMRKIFFHDLSVCYDILLNFLEGHEEAIAILDEVIEDSWIESILKEEN